MARLFRLRDLTQEQRDDVWRYLLGEIEAKELYDRGVTPVVEYGGPDGVDKLIGFEERCDAVGHQKT